MLNWPGIIGTVLVVALVIALGGGSLVAAVGGAIMAFGVIILIVSAYIQGRRGWRP